MASSAPRLLIVDDDETNRGFLTKFLTRAGFSVTTAGSGEEAISAAETGSFELVLLDVEMPGTNGLEVLVRLRDFHSIAALPIIMVSGRGQTGDQLAALRLGANDYVTKPFHASLLVAKIQGLLASRRPVAAKASDSSSAVTVARPDVGATADRVASPTEPGGSSGLKISGYEVISELGRGGMGTVYKARHLHMDRVVALKLIRAEFVDRPPIVRRFYQEVKAAARMHHPNLVMAYDAGQVGETHYLAMEFVDGPDLAKLVAANGPLDVTEACGLMRQAALGLQHVLQCGLVHRDIKPSNLLVSSDGVLKVADLGLALLRQPDSVVSPGLTAEGRWVGTADYVAPEQCTDPRNVDIRADLYSLGCTFFHLLSGQVPFPQTAILDKVLGHGYSEPTPLVQLRPEVPPEVAGLVSRLMAKKPVDRFQTPAELVSALSGLA
jgi:CheY-like chemotaxis protein/tRNA A-37 threonylcarbamoyl transferase component Bud32